MDLDRMLELCRRNQWHVDDLDWSAAPRPMPREQEMAVVQYFTDMAGIELLAAALFEVQRDRSEEPVLRDIFETFVVDEIRHSRVAERLAHHYDRNHYKIYFRNAHMERFRRHFVDALEHVSPEIANAYITTGELLLDIALLRSLNDYVDDEMSHQAMEKINRDESRHIAMDFFMIERYASPEHVAAEAAKPPKPPLELLRGWWAVGSFMMAGRPFFRDVFFGPMELTDPSGARMREAFKRAQLIGERPDVAARPFSRFMQRLQDAFMHPVIGPIARPLVTRIMGVDPSVIRPLYDDAEARRAAHMSLEEQAREALGERDPLVAQA
ncbi:MAG: hypothetical protein ACODAU_13105 [Myxococcota bacterium]